MNCKNILKLIACDEPDGFDHWRILARREKLVFVILLDELAAALLDRQPDLPQISSLDLYGHEAIDQGKSVIEVRAEYNSHEKA